PTEDARSHLGAEIGHTFNRVRISLGGGLTGFDYDDTPRVLPAVPAAFNNDDRDRTVTDFFAKLSVKASEDTAIFLRGRIDDHDFDALVDDDGFNRDSSGVGLDGGIEFRMTHVLVGEVFAGYTLRSFDDAAFADANEFAFGAGLKWFPSMLTTVRLDAARGVEDTSITAASSFVSTRGEVGIDHEILRNFILSGRLGYENAEYLGVGRDDDILHGSLSGRYLINNSFHFDAGWEYIDRSSTALPFEYSTGQFQFSLTGKM
ncbi:MAG: outer membrane beta-barrel protein, partial [Micropepsaceae bacterium]